MGMIDDLKARNAKAMAAKGDTPATPATPPAKGPATPPAKGPATPPATPATPPAKGPATNPVDVLKKIQAQKAAPASTAPADDRPKAPWHFPGCVACSENPYGGFNSKGAACEICDAQSEQHGKLKSVDYTWDYDESNNLVFTQVPGATPTFPEKAEKPAEEKPVEEKPKKVKTRKPRTKKQKAPPVTEEPVVETPPVAEVPVVEAPAETTPEPPQEPADGFKLLIGCTFFKNVAGEAVSADTLLAEALKNIETPTGKPAAEIEHFALLQGIDTQIPDIAQALALSGAWVVSFQPTKGTALARLVDGLRRYADTVIVNIGM